MSEVVVDFSAVNELLTSPQRGVTRDLVRRGLRVQAAARRLAPSDTGRLRQSITMAVVTVPSLHVLVGSNLEYALLVHRGTGIYGPNRLPIRSASHGYLRFTPKTRTTPTGRVRIRSRDQNVVFTRSVRGQRGVPYLKNALVAAR